MDSWCAISKSVNHIYDHGFKRRSVSFSIRTVKSQCVAKFRFASILELACFLLYWNTIKYRKKKVGTTAFSTTVETDKHFDLAF